MATRALAGSLWPVEAARHIRAVEEGLLPVVRVRGRNDGPFRLAERMALDNVPAVSVAVVADGSIEWTRAYGLADAALRRATSESTRFQAASISKPVVAFAVLRLVDQGKLDLDRDVNDYLRSWRLPENEFTRSRPVTLRHLLSHTGSVTVSGFPGYAVGTPLPTLRQILDGEPPANTQPIRVDGSVGAAFRYAGGGTTIVHQLLEDVSGVAFPALLEDLVLGPLQMTQSAFAQPPPAALADESASAHEGGSPIADRWHVYPELAAAGLWSTPRDLARFAVAVQNAYAGRGLIPRTLAVDMLTPQFTPLVGLGPFLEGDGPALRFVHSGGNRGFSCRLAAYAASGRGAVVMTNAGGSGAAELISEVLNAIAATYAWPGYLAEELDLVAIDASRFEHCLGEYELPGLGTLRVWRDAERLRVNGPGGESDLLPLSDTTFVVDGAGYRLRFDEDGGGISVRLGGQELRAIRRG